MKPYYLLDIIRRYGMYLGPFTKHDNYPPSMVFVYVTQRMELYLKNIFDERSF